jgi:hypothetical protein
MTTTVTLSTLASMAEKKTMTTVGVVETAAMMATRKATPNALA